MSDMAIKAEGLGKKYVIGHLSRHTNATETLREKVIEKTTSGLGKARDYLLGRPIVIGDRAEDFWALKDVDFEIRKGEIVGFVGRNGAGKSTLLKILSRITEPSAGNAKIYGRVSSLLEVGAGFHAELTGRENIYLNGAILGMPRAVIRKNFDEIVAFSGVERFLDTPVKRYSSGMYVRLAFSVAVHLLSDILIVDEVLAVGDVEFQKKCLGKMEDVAQSQGRTVLFVTHNMGLVTSLCDRAFLLEAGRVTRSGTPAEIVSNYYSGSHGTPFSVDFEKGARRIGDSMATLLAARIENDKGATVGEVGIGTDFVVIMRYKLHGDYVRPPEPIFQFNTSGGQCAFVSVCTNKTAEAGIYEAVCKVPKNLLNSDTYYIDLMLRHSNVIDTFNFIERNALSVLVVDRSAHGILSDAKSVGSLGVVRPALDWSVRTVA
jgi:lipopolysaccharide transport system ATP-binding protein